MQSQPGRQVAVSDSSSIRRDLLLSPPFTGIWYYWLLEEFVQKNVSDSIFLFSSWSIHHSQAVWSLNVGVFHSGFISSAASWMMRLKGWGSYTDLFGKLKILPPDRSWIIFLSARQPAGYTFWVAAWPKASQRGLSN